MGATSNQDLGLGPPPHKLIRPPPRAPPPSHRTRTPSSRLPARPPGRPRPVGRELLPCRPPRCASSVLARRHAHAETSSPRRCLHIRRRLIAPSFPSSHRSGSPTGRSLLSTLRMPAPWRSRTAAGRCLGSSLRSSSRRRRATGSSRRRFSTPRLWASSRPPLAERRQMTWRRRRSPLPFSPPEQGAGRLLSLIFCTYQ